MELADALRNIEWKENKELYCLACFLLKDSLSKNFRTGLDRKGWVWLNFIPACAMPLAERMNDKKKDKKSLTKEKPFITMEANIGDTIHKGVMRGANFRYRR